MTPQEFLDAMKARDDSDEERADSEAVSLMCRVLRELGYGEGVDIFENVDLWSG